MYVFILLVHSAELFNFLFYVHQTLSQNVGTGILIIKRPSGRNWRPWRDLHFRTPPLPLLEGVFPSHPTPLISHTLRLLVLIISKRQFPEPPLPAELIVVCPLPQSPSPLAICQISHDVISLVFFLPPHQPPQKP